MSGCEFDIECPLCGCAKCRCHESCLAEIVRLTSERDEAREDRALCLAENDRLILLNKELSDTALSASVRRVAEATADAHAELRAMAIREETAYNERDRMERERDEARAELAAIRSEATARACVEAIKKMEGYDSDIWPTAFTNDDDAAAAILAVLSKPEVP